MTESGAGMAEALPVFDLNACDGVQDKQACGFKAHNLMRMAALGLSVPTGFVLGTAWCQAMRCKATTADRLAGVLEDRIRLLEHQTGLGFGSSRRPLLVSVRSGAPVSMPGMMDTVLNVGLNEDSLTGLLRVTGDHRLVWDSYSRLIMAFAEIVAGVSVVPFEHALNTALRRSGAQTSRELDFRALRELAQTFLALYQEHAGADFPRDPMEQLRAATAAVFSSWTSEKALAYRSLNAIPDDIGTAVTVQRMVFGNASGNSGAGVGFTRDPATGENRPYVDWLAHAQGEDIVSGRRRVDVEAQIPAWLMQKLGKIGDTLETAFRDAQEYEFTVENGELFMLQTRSAKRTPLAALRIAADQLESGLITLEEAVARVAAIELDELIIRRIESSDAPVGYATPAGVGVACGPAALSQDAAKRFADLGAPPILIRREMATDDINAITTASGILTAAGSRTAHAAVVARQMGKVCLVGCRDLIVDEVAGQARVGQTVISEGDPICLDASAGAIYAGSPGIVSERPTELIERVRRWRARAASD
ncbi:MAG TPA: PEP/pyruvate-binding domain-containing protein [Gammaproteobacteria bacterium]|nr:PEP/pyruvate-binding domain-containing protein [Gammaproteobacteria bacterium]